MKVIGVGNAMRGDDGIGPAVIRMLEVENPHGLEVIIAPGDGAALMECWSDEDVVILVDAVHSGGEPGTIYRLDAFKERMPQSFFHYSTHAFGVAEAIEMGRALGRLPAELIVFGVEGESFGGGERLSPAVARACRETAGRIETEINNRYAPTKQERNPSTHARSVPPAF